jgi:uncharacterized membrane protein YeaQ/YmgE (transglycosylase-associated protein family)
MPANRATKTIIGVLGTIVLGTIGSLLANVLWGAKNVFSEIHKVLTYSVPVWALLLIVISIATIIFLFKSKKFLMWHANLVLKKKRRTVQVQRPVQRPAPVQKQAVNH